MENNKRLDAKTSSFKIDLEHLIKELQENKKLQDALTKIVTNCDNVLKRPK